MSNEAPATKHCADCGAVVTGKFCSECGQLYGIEQEGLRQAIFVDSSSGERQNRVLKTLIKLITDPGGLINEFIQGRRTRYIRPVRLYVFLAGIYFLMWAYLEPAPVPPNLVETMQETVKPRELDAARFEARYQSAINTVMPLAVAASLPALMLVLKLMYRRRSWHDHFVTILYFSALQWSVGIVTLPLALINMWISSVPTILVIVGYLWPILKRVYPESTKARVFHFCFYLAADLAITALWSMSCSVAAILWALQ